MEAKAALEGIKLAHGIDGPRSSRWNWTVTQNASGFVSPRVIYSFESDQMGNWILCRGFPVSSLIAFSSLPRPHFCRFLLLD
jgi:hypothetical protein